MHLGPPLPQEEGDDGHDSHDKDGPDRGTVGNVHVGFDAHAVLGKVGGDAGRLAVRAAAGATGA